MPIREVVQNIRRVVNNRNIFDTGLIATSISLIATGAREPLTLTLQEPFLKASSDFHHLGQSAFWAVTKIGDGNIREAARILSHTNLVHLWSDNRLVNAPVAQQCLSATNYNDLIIQASQKLQGYLAGVPNIDPSSVIDSLTRASEVAGLCRSEYLNAIPGYIGLIDNLMRIPEALLVPGIALMVVGGMGMVTHGLLNRRRRSSN
jgi:hypothetical protein